MRHPVLPQKMTVEQLAQWLTENHVEKVLHEEKTTLSPEEIHEQEQKIRYATAALYDLEDLLKQIKDTFAKGTPVDPASPEDEVKYLPMNYTIPPTKGTKELEANRKHADELLKAGHRIETTELYGIPWGQEKKIVFFDSEGMEYSQYLRDMTPEQMAAHGKLFDGEVQKAMKPLKDTIKKLNNHGIDVTMEADGKSKTFKGLDHPTKETPLFDEDDASPLSV